MQRALSLNEAWRVENNVKREFNKSWSFMQKKVAASTVLVAFVIFYANNITL